MCNYRHKRNTEQLKHFAKLGYKWKIDKYGYQVWFNDEYIKGAGTTRGRKVHYKHAEKNIIDYTQTVLTICIRHNNKQ